MLSNKFKPIALYEQIFLPLSLSCKGIPVVKSMLNSNSVVLQKTEDR